MANPSTVDVLLSGPKGVIVACNLLHSLDDGLVDKATVQELLDWWFALYDFLYAPGLTDVEKLLDALDKTVFERKPPGFRKGQSKPNFRLRCKLKARTPNNNVTNISTMLIFREHIIHEEDYKKLIGCHIPSLPMDVNEPGIQHAIHQLKACTVGKLRCRLRPNSTLGRSGGLLWFTEERSLQIGKDSANEVRDQLGLVDRKKGELLVMSVISPHHVKRAGGLRPSFMDATLHTRFRVHSDTKKNNGRKTWGHTVNLEKFADNRSHIDGVCERVCRPLAASNVGTVDFLFLGDVQSTRGKNGDDDTAFSQRLLQYYGDKKTLKKRITNL
ncbi:hypothetical protein [Thiolapillus brandeum]|uniref:Uncharacterized protein n=1 Tax=Thiolapillus brandeum TaxID=1076588 RepID=A0A7U6JFS3_9GAMM|nr:hypothetical protein [Thiolapillus brandeum]BAO43041.1 hypothetical protein TBH_C0093 [Thiolapillus brandeum]